MINKRDTVYKRIFKRPLDLLVSIITIFLLSPIIIIIAVLVKIKLGSPVIFKQSRPGLNEEIFTMYKFRSMTDERGANGELLPDNIRLTKFGKILRATSLDELPGLFNILKGDMSIVGPRPLSVKYLPYYNEKEKLRHTVRPGLTGYAQINGRNLIGWEDRFEYDIEYVKNISFKKDIVIIFKTIIKVFKRDGVAIRGTTKNINFHEYRQQQLEKKKLDTER